MRLSSTDRGAIDRLKNHFISKMIPGVGTWGEIDALRGWKDDFFGDSIHEQYTAVSAGAGSGGALQNNAHGGVYLLTAGATSGFYHYLWLGNAADGYATLDADLGWVQIAYLRHIDSGAAGNQQTTFGASNAAISRYIQAGINEVVVAGNWMIDCQDAAGRTTVDSGVAYDSGWHWHVLSVYPITGGGRQADYLLDGALIASNTANIFTDPITPIIRCYAQSANQRRLELDFWGVIPRNLV